MWPLLVVMSTALAPTDIRCRVPIIGEARGVSRRALLSNMAIAAGVSCIPAYAAEELNEAEQKLQVILAKKVKEREAALGFTLEAEDIREVENILRNKYCGPYGAFSGEPGGSCAEAPLPGGTCFKASGKAASCITSYGSG